MAYEFNWSQSGSNESQLLTLNIVTSLYYNPVEPNNPEPETEDLPEPEEPDEDHHVELKRHFLDRLAEIWSRKRTARSVSAAVLQETGAGVTIWLGRNQDERCNNDRDNDFRSAIENFMRAAAKKDCPGPDFEEFWPHLLRFYRPRINHYVKMMLPGLTEGRKCVSKRLKRGNHEATDIDHEATDVPYRVLERLQKLQTLLSKKCPRPLPSDSINKAILLAHELRQEPDVGSFIHRLFSTQTSQKSPRDLVKGILFLGRVKSAYNCFLNCPRIMPIFKHTTIKIVESFPAREPQSRIRSNSQVTKLLEGLGLQDILTKFPNFQDCFQREWRQLMHVHAEVAVLIRLEERNVDSRTLFNYVGCSKKSCFLCFHILRRYGFRSCGCHDKVYHQWTVPEVRGVSAPLVRALSAGLLEIQQQLMNHIRKRSVPQVGKRLSLIAESTAGLTPLLVRELYEQQEELWGRHSYPVVA